MLVFIIALVAGLLFFKYWGKSSADHTSANDSQTEANTASFDSEVHAGNNFCANCGAKVQQGDKFCLNCGKRLDEA